MAALPLNTQSVLNEEAMVWFAFATTISQSNHSFNLSSMSAAATTADSFCSLYVGAQVASAFATPRHNVRMSEAMLDILVQPAFVLLMQICINVGGTKYETRFKTLLKGAAQGSKVLSGICRTLQSQQTNAVAIPDLLI